MSSPKTNAPPRRKPGEESHSVFTNASVTEHSSDVELNSSAESFENGSTALAEDVAPESYFPETDVQDLLVQLRSFLAGEGSEQPSLDSKDEIFRQSVAAELIKVISDTEETVSDDDDSSKELLRSRHYRARQLFVDYGYLDDVIKQLGSAGAVQRRAEAARTLGIIRSQRATAPLIAALFDEEVDVRNAAAKSLAQIGDPAVTIDPVSIGIAPKESEKSVAEQATEESAQSAEHDNPEVNSEASRIEMMYPLTLGDAGESAFKESDQMTLDAQSISDSDSEQHDRALQKIEQLEAQLLAAVNARNQAEKEVLLRLDQESRFRAEAAGRRHEDEEARKKAEEKAARRRYEDERKLATEQLARIRVEEELQEHSANEDRLRLELSSAKQQIEAIARARAEAEITQEKTRRDEAEGARRTLLERYAADVDELRREEESLRAAVEQASLKRNEVEMARQGVELQTQRLAEATARLASMQAAFREEYDRVVETENRSRREQETLAQRAQELQQQSEIIASRRSEIEAMTLKLESEREEVEAAKSHIEGLDKKHRQAQIDRQQFENELRRRTEEEERLLDEMRSHLQEQEKRLRMAASQRNDEYESRLKDLDALKRQLDEDADRRAEEETLISQEVEALRSNELEMRKRIEEAEARRNTAEETKRVLVEQVQRIEADAHVRALEEERLLAKLEQARRNAEMESQTRAEKADKIKQETENLRALEAEHRNRLEEESRRRADIEARLHQERERLRMAEQVRVKTEVLLETLPQIEPTLPEEPRLVDAIGTSSESTNDTESGGANASMSQSSDLDRAAALPESIVAGLNSAHPHKRAAAISQLPALTTTDSVSSFHLIVEYFDDPSPEVRDAAAKALRDLEPLRPAESFTRALEDAPSNRGRNIGKALASSGIADEAINNLDSENREETYNALCLLFVMAKTGEVQPLVEAIENHQDAEVRRAAIKLLNLSGQSELADAAAKRRLGLSASAHSNS